MSQVYCTKTSKVGTSRHIALGIVLLFLIGLVPSTTALPTPGFNGEASDAVVGRIFPEALQTNDYIGFFEALDGINLLEERFPGWVTYRETGQSYGLNNPAGGRDTFPVMIVEVTNPDSPIAYDDKVQLLFMLSIHGNEKGGREGGLRIIEDFARGMGMAQWTQQNGAGNGTMRDYLDFMTLIFLFPNPDGWAHDEPQYLTGTVEADPSSTVPVDPKCGNGVVFYCRTNGRAVDLNREVPTTGWYHEPYSALSEPESQAFANFVIENYKNLVAATDIHGMLWDDHYVLTLMPAGQADPHKMTQSTRMAELLKERLNTDPEFSEYRAAEVPGAWGGDVNDWGTVWDTISYTDSGFNGDWFFQNNGLDVPGYDIELAYNHITFDSQYELGAYFNHLHIQSTRQIIGTFMDAMAQDLQVAIDVKGTKTAVLANPVVVTNTDDTEPLGGWAAENPFDDAWDYANNDFYAAPQDYWTELKPYLKDEDAPGVLDELNPVDITAKKLARYSSLVIPGSAIQTIENDTAKIQVIYDWVQAGGHLVLTDSALKYLAKAGVTGEDGVDVVNLYAGYSNFFDRSHPLVSPIRGIARQLYEPVPLGFSVRSNAAPNWFVEESALPEGSTKLGWVPIPQSGDDDGLPWFVPDPEPPGAPDTSNINVGEIPLGEGRIRFIGSLLPDPSEEFYHPYGLDSYATTYSGNHLMRLFLDWEQVFEAPPALVTLKGVSYTPPQSVLPNSAGGDKEVDEKESPGIAPLTALLALGAAVFLARKRR